MLSLYLCAIFQVKYPSMSRLVVFEFVNMALFLAVWIALADNISCNTSYCRVTYRGSRSFIRPCQTIYAAFAFAIVEWLLFLATFAGAIRGVVRERKRAGTKERADEA